MMKKSQDGSSQVKPKFLSKFYIIFDGFSYYNHHGVEIPVILLVERTVM